MSEALWAQRPRPTPGPDATAVGRWKPTTAAELTAHRRQLSAALQHATGAADADEVAVERLLLAFEELASNALRHSRGPIRVTVTADRDGWLLEVSDAAADRPPTPAVGATRPTAASACTWSPVSPPRTVGTSTASTRSCGAASTSTTAGPRQRRRSRTLAGAAPTTDTR